MCWWWFLNVFWVFNVSIRINFKTYSIFTVKDESYIVCVFWRYWNACAWRRGFSCHLYMAKASIFFFFVSLNWVFHEFLCTNICWGWFPDLIKVVEVPIPMILSVRKLFSWYIVFECLTSARFLCEPLSEVFVVGAFKIDCYNLCFFEF